MSPPGFLKLFSAPSFSLVGGLSILPASARFSAHPHPPSFKGSPASFTPTHIHTISPPPPLTPSRQVLKVLSTDALKACCKPGQSALGETMPCAFPQLPACAEPGAMSHGIVSLLSLHQDQHGLYYIHEDLGPREAGPLPKEAQQLSVD